ncbi:MAG TPA: ParB N-terminal domain-containing protein [Verrucomicrobiae bacterium]|nr:ParB N-terminal domain-containing protein [Verrucomicrobiae bacterium]
MAKTIDTTPPSWMVVSPEKPVLVEQKFHDKVIPVWKGEVELDTIVGWLGNPRIELLREQFYDNFAREPTNEEMCQLVLTDDDEKEGLKIKELAANIAKNGVRVPLVLTYDKKLLDGNRRYYACAFLASDKKNKDAYKRVPVHVLQKNTTTDVEDAIITEFNFAADMQVQWPYYIRARAVYKDSDEKGLEKDELVQKYGMPWRYLDKWVKAARLCERFLRFHNETHNAKQFAYRNFIMFDEMMRNYGARFNEAAFRERVFTCLLKGYEPENHKGHTFTRSSDVIRLDEMYDNADAWQTLSNGSGPHALQEAMAILDMSNAGGASDPNPALRRLVNGLDRLTKNKALGSANQDLLQAFQEKAQKVPGGLSDPVSQINQMVEWLEGMTTKQVADLSEASLNKLEQALRLVIAHKSGEKATTKRRP